MRARSGRFCVLESLPVPRPVALARVRSAAAKPWALDGSRSLQLREWTQGGCLQPYARGGTRRHHPQHVIDAMPGGACVAARRSAPPSPPPQPERSAGIRVFTIVNSFGAKRANLFTDVNTRDFGCRPGRAPGVVRHVAALGWAPAGWKIHSLGSCCRQCTCVSAQAPHCRRPHPSWSVSGAGTY